MFNEFMYNIFPKLYYHKNIDIFSLKLFIDLLRRIKIIILFKYNLLYQTKKKHY